MMITHYALHYKNRILQSFLILALGLFCYAFARNITTINDDITPLSGGNVEAMFYIENPDTGSMTCIGDGLINSTEEKLDSESISKTIITAPNYAAIIGNAQTINWHQLKNVNGKYQVIGTIVSNNNTHSATYNDISEMKNANLKSGSIVSTKGYYEQNDNGYATYIITNNPTYPIDNTFVIPLTNGLYAEMQFTSDSIINVASAGIDPNNCNSDALNTLIHNVFYNGAKGIKFNDGTYVIDKPILLESLDYYGDSNTTISVGNNFSTPDDKIIYTLPNSNSNYNLVFDSINFLFETTNSHPLHDKETVFLALHNIDSCLINNCSIISRPSSENGDFMKVDNLWFRFSEKHKNITIKNSSILNLTGSAYKGNASDILVGGVIWITGKGNSSSISNVLLENVNMETTTTDEAFAMWNGHFSNIKIKNCSLHNYAHLSHNLITLANGLFTDVVFDNMNAIVNAPTSYVFKTYAILENSNINLTNCNVKIDNNSTDDLNYSIILTSSNTSNTIYTINSSTFDISNTSKYRSFITVTNANDTNYSFNNCSVSGLLTYGFAFLEKTNHIDMSCSSTYINTKNVLMNLKRAYNCNLDFNNNQIDSKITTVVNVEGDFNYEFSNNTITANNPGSIISTNQLRNISSKSNLVLSQNYLANGKTPSIYQTNCNVPEETYLTVTKQ